MVQSFTSSMSPTKYASESCCRHKMVCPWKHRSYLPTSRAISWTNHEKGHFQMRSSVLFWNQQILWRATIPVWYFCVFFQWCSLQEFLLGGFASHSKLELLVSWLLPTQHRWPSLHSHLGQMLGWWWLWWPPHLLQLLHFCNPPDDLLWTQRGFLYWWWGCTSVGDPLDLTCTCALVWTSVLACIWACIIIPTSLLPFPLWGVLFVLAILEFRRKESQLIRRQYGLVRVTCTHLEFLISMMPLFLWEPLSCCWVNLLPF